MEETQNSVKRGKSFTNDQDVAICTAWLSVTQDPTLVNSCQTSIGFWERVLENYINNANDECSRSRRSIESRCGKIIRCCNKFRGYLSNVENIQHGGATQSDKFLQAKLLYSQLENKPFTFDHCWDILQNSHSVKWQDFVKHRKRTFANGSPNNLYAPSEVPRTPISLSSNHDPLEDHIVDVDHDDDDDDDNDDDIDDRNAKRLIDNEVLRELQKKSKVAELDTASKHFCDLFSEFNKQACETEKRKALVQERKLKILEEANERERKKAEVELKIMMERNEREQKEKDDQIMMMDTSNMELQAKAYFEHRKAEILAKLKGLSSP